MNENNVIELRHITKTFPGIKANDDISLTLRKGEIHALLGENGAGKSTLMSVLFGLYEPDSGEILVNGKPEKIKNPNDATRLGIGMVHQHFKLVECYTAIQNIILGYEPTTKFFGFLKPKAVTKSLRDLCDKYHFKVDLNMKIEDMPVGEQQKVEILKMLYRKNDILIFDEPTAVLTPQEIEDLMQSMKGLAKEGKSILFISHKLNEIMEVADRVTVLRKGKCLGTLNVKDTNMQELSRLMVGRDVELVTQKDEAKIGKDVLTVSHLTVMNAEKKKEAVHDVSFTVRQGEIVCIAGIEGNGQTELVYSLAGLEKIRSGSAVLHNVDRYRFLKLGKDGKENGFVHFFRMVHETTHWLCFSAKENTQAFFINIGRHCRALVSKKHPYEAYAAKKMLSPFKEDKLPQYADAHLEDMSIRKRSISGVSHIPEDRQKYGLALDFSLKDNLVLQRYFEAQFQTAGFLRENNKYYYSDELIRKYDIRSSLGPDTIVRSMSGGNQQKAIIARELDRNTPLLIAVQPTRGLDVGAIEFIHHQIIKQRDNGSGVLLISLELDEVMNLSDRILVMYNGEIVAELDPKKTNVKEIGLYMSGAKRMDLKTHEDLPAKGKENPND
jgi:ABC-type uncharacterized transport system ATPase subunit